MRNKCDDCPYIKNGDRYKHQSWINMLDNSPTHCDKIHKCHCITSDAWGIKSPINNSNVCVGRIQYLKSKNGL